MAIGELAQKHNVQHLVLTHLIPQPKNDVDAQKFADDARAGGYTGRITVGNDLLRVTLGERLMAPL